MPSEEVKRVAELRRKMHRATSVKEIIELSSQYGRGFTEEEAKEYLSLITSYTLYHLYYIKTSFSFSDLFYQLFL